MYVLNLRRLLSSSLSHEYIFQSHHRVFRLQQRVLPLLLHHLSVYKIFKSFSFCTFNVYTSNISCASCSSSVRLCVLHNHLAGTISWKRVLLVPYSLIRSSVSPCLRIFIVSFLSKLGLCNISCIKD